MAPSRVSLPSPFSSLAFSSFGSLFPSITYSLSFLFAFPISLSLLPIPAIYTTLMLWMLTPEPTVADCDLLQIDLPPGELWGGGT